MPELNYESGVDRAVARRGRRRQTKWWILAGVGFVALVVVILFDVFLYLINQPTMAHITLTIANADSDVDFLVLKNFTGTPHEQFVKIRTSVPFSKMTDWAVLPRYPGSSTTKG